MTQKLKKQIRKFSKAKQDKPVVFSGELGVPLNGSKVVEVPNRKGFVFVRLKGNSSELIQAHNAVVSPVYGLPVLVGRSGNIYQIVGQNTSTYQGVSTTPYLPKHGPQHSFNHNLGIGGDIVWVYGQQFMPLLSYPSGSVGSMTLTLEPSFYEWQGTWRYAQQTGTPNYTPYLPTITGSARMVLSYIDPSDNSIRLVPGTPFDGSVTGSAQIAQYIPDIPRSVGIPLAAVRLTTGTTTIGWDAIYDVRDFYTVSQPTGTFVDTIGFAGLDEGVPIGTGTFLNVTGDLSFTRSGTMFNLSYTAGGPGGGGGGAGIMGWDEGVPLATGTILNAVGGGVTLTSSGTVLNLSVPQSPITTLFDQYVTAGLGQASFDAFVSGTYNMLSFFVNAALVSGTSSGNVVISFNNDSTDVNYRRGSHRASSTSHVYAGADDRVVGVIPGATATRPKASGHIEGKILDPFGTVFEKNVATKNVVRFATDEEVWEFGVEWENTAAINRITFVTSNGNFASGTHCAIYGHI